jgi:hypothetical protein
MKKALGMLLVVVGLSSVMLAEQAPIAPEIDGMTALSALTLLSGAVMVLRSRKK